MLNFGTVWTESVGSVCGKVNDKMKQKKTFKGQKPFGRKLATMLGAVAFCLIAVCTIAIYGITAKVEVAPNRETKAAVTTTDMISTLSMQNQNAGVIGKRFVEKTKTVKETTVSKKKEANKTTSKKTKQTKASVVKKTTKSTTKKAVKAAKKNGSLISFDPNLREPLWESLEEAKKQMEYGFEQCDILKISDNEIQFITGIEDYDQGVLYLQNKYEIPLILLTMGKKGSRAYYKDFRIEEKGFQVSTIETTGAGDTFCGCSLAYILEHDINNLTEDHLREMLIFANAGAALVTTKKGAICSMPERREIVDLIDVGRNAIHQF